MVDLGQTRDQFIPMDAVKTPPASAASHGAEIETVSLGCRLNAYESEAMRKLANAQQMKNTIIINTCAVTKEATRQSRQAIRKARKRRPDARIIATGCAVQIEPDAFRAMPEIDRLVGNHEKLQPARYAPEDQSFDRIGDIARHVDLVLPRIHRFEGRSRAIVQIQNGCDHDCTFCIIPAGRGAARSVGAGAIIRQIELLAEQNYSEITLTGVDISSWGKDLPGTPPLGNLVRRILKTLPQLKRLRLSSIDPGVDDPDLLSAYAEHQRLVPYIHLSIQSGAPLILKRMKRRHDPTRLVALCDALRSARPDITIGADLIAGFPTETDEDFQASLALIEDLGLTWLHIFPYSVREGTKAALMPQLEPALIRSRAKTLREAGQRALVRHLTSRIGDRDMALMEASGMGRLPDFTRVRLAEGESGDLIPVRITGIREKNNLACAEAERCDEQG